MRYRGEQELFTCAHANNYHGRKIDYDSKTD